MRRERKGPTSLFPVLLSKSSWSPTASMSSQESAPPAGPRMCTGKNCNFYGNPMTGMCSKCYREEMAARQASATTPGAAPTPSVVVTPAVASSSSSASLSAAAAKPTSSAPVAIPGSRAMLVDDLSSASLPNGGGTFRVGARLRVANTKAKELKGRDVGGRV